MSKSNQPEPTEILNSKYPILMILDCSSSTLNRKIKAKEFPKPDIQGGDGRPNRWFKSTVDNYLSELKNMGAA